MRIYHICLTVLLFFTGNLLYAQTNPFMPMAGKKYADYFLELDNEFEKFSNFTDTTKARKVIRQIEEVANITGITRWKLHAAYFELELFRMKQSLFGTELFHEEDYKKMLLSYLDKAEKYNIVPFILIFRQYAIDYCWHAHDYEFAFELYALQKKQLETISLEDVPDKLRYYLRIADAHYFFKDYLNAIDYYNKILEEEDNSYAPNIKQHARNDLGLCYRYGFNDLDRSDSYFLSILDTDNFKRKDKDYYNVWSGIAEGNMGYNMFLRGKYDKAIIMLKSSLKKMVKAQDYAFAARPAINLANIYLSKGNPKEAKHFIDLAYQYYNNMPKEHLLPNIYEAFSKYYAETGNTKLSLIYMDSMLVEIKKQEERFSALQMLRVEQRNFLAEKILNEKQLNVEKMKTQAYRRSMIIIFIALLLLGSVLTHCIFIYNKKKNAYRELVRKSKEWAHISPELIDPDIVEQDELWDDYENGNGNGNGKQNGLPDDVDQLIMKDIEQLVVKEKLYEDPNLSIDSLAHKLNAKRHYVSGAINRCMKKNFNTYINEYRIKEAIQLLSAKKSEDLTIETIAFVVGFANYLNFYRVFKRMTGLSPVEFKRNN